MTETSNRTFVCCVLFLDIVEYSKMSVTEQLSLKQRFNELLVNALKHVVANDRIVLDTGDGAAVSFLGNPEDSLFAAMTLRDALAAQDPKQTPPLKVRIGLNLGPVRLVKDINGQLNIIGDGINVAQRVMSFAEPGSIMVSRSYFEVVARLSPDYERMFQYDGTRTDKHVREHAVYVVGPAEGSADQTSADDVVAVAPSQETKAPAPAPAAGGKSNKRVIAAVAIAIAVVGAAIALRMARNKDAFEQVEPQLAAASSAAAKKDEAKKDDGKKDDAKKAPAALADAAPKSPTAPAVTAAPEAPKAPAKVAVSLVIAPWGEVYVDGKMKGVSPPLKSLTLSPGKHKIEIRNTTFPAHVVEIDDSVKDKIKIQHKF